ncbi:hypothetical protein ACOTHJ_16025 [Achromobacter xylosoxidans]
MTHPTGYTCKTCNTAHLYPAYVCAHWDEKLDHICGTCGAKHTILRGVATQRQQGTLPSEPPADQFRPGDVWNNSRGTPHRVDTVVRRGRAHMTNLKTMRTVNRAWDDIGWKSGKPWVRVSCGAASGQPQGSYYVHFNGVSVFVKEAEFFEQQKRDEPSWNTSRWKGPICADSIEQARSIGQQMADRGEWVGTRRFA